MIVVADARPIQYLLRTGAIDPGADCGGRVGMLQFMGDGVRHKDLML